MCEPEFSLESVWHVLDVLEGSPAESAGLVPYGDWIIGWSGGVLSAEGDFYDVVEAVCVFFSPPCGSAHAFYSISTSLCGFTYTHTTLSMFEECRETILLNFVCLAPYEKLCLFLIATGAAKGYWDACLGNSGSSSFTYRT